MKRAKHTTIDDQFLHFPAPDLTSKAKPGKKVEVTYPVSYSYNGGTVIDDKWYAGYEVPKPIVPKGYKLTSIGVGLQLNAHPPYATMILEPIDKSASVGATVSGRCAALN